MTKLKFVIALASVITSSLTCNIANAHFMDYIKDDNVNYNIFGYYSQSAVMANGVNMGGSKGEGDWSFSKRELALFGDANIAPIGTDFRFAISSIDEPELYGKNGVDIKYLLLDKQWNVSDSNTVGVRVGRVPFTIGFWNQTRTSPTTGQFIYMPEGLYREQFKWWETSGDGLQLYCNHSFSIKSDVSVTASHTRPNFGPNREVVAGYLAAPVGTFDASKSSINSLTIDYRYDNTNFYYHYMQFNYFLEPDFPFSMVIPKASTHDNAHVFGIKHFFDKFSVSAEFLKLQFKGDVGDAITAGAEDLGMPIGYNVSATYHATDKLDISAYASYHYIAQNDKYCTERVARGLMPPGSEKWCYAESKSIAAKYSYNEDWTFRAQYTIGKGTESFNIITNPNAKEDWDMLSLQAIYSF